MRARKVGLASGNGDRAPCHHPDRDRRSRNLFFWYFFGEGEKEAYRVIRKRKETGGEGSGTGSTERRNCINVNSKIKKDHYNGFKIPHTACNFVYCGAAACELCDHSV